MSCKARKREIRKAKASHGKEWHQAVAPVAAPAPRRGALSLALLALVPFLR